jgi:DNA-directed RNA polymerase
VLEEEAWLIKSAIKDLHIYKNQEEFYQEGLIGLWEAYERFDPSKGASFRTFAYKTIRGKLLTHLRKAVKNEENMVTFSAAIEETTIDEKATIPFEVELLSYYCEGLSNAQRKWVYKAFLENKGPKQIAAEEGVSLETVKTWRRYALQKIRRNITAGLI